MTDNQQDKELQKEQKLLEYLRQVGIPFGEVVIRFFFQDGAIVRLVVEDKKESLKL